MCILSKERAIREMVRVARKDGYICIHDLCWKESAPEQMKQRLSDVEGERPETLEGWKRLFETEGLHDVTALDRSYLMPVWMKEVNDRIGVFTRLKIALDSDQKVGNRRLQNDCLGADIAQHSYRYGIIVGRKA